MNTPRKIKLKWGHYPLKNNNIGFAFKHLEDHFAAHNNKVEARILRNLRVARSNYLNALNKNTQGQKYYLKSHKKTFINAKKTAEKLVYEMKSCPCGLIFAAYIDIENYLNFECKIDEI